MRPFAISISFNMLCVVILNILYACSTLFPQYPNQTLELLIYMGLSVSSIIAVCPSSVWNEYKSETLLAIIFGLILTGTLTILLCVTANSNIMGYYACHYMMLACIMMTRPIAIHLAISSMRNKLKSIRKQLILVTFIAGLIVIEYYTVITLPRDSIVTATKYIVIGVCLREIWDRISYMKKIQLSFCTLLFGIILYLIGMVNPPLATHATFHLVAYFIMTMSLLLGDEST